MVVSVGTRVERLKHDHMEALSTGVYCILVYDMLIDRQTQTTMAGLTNSNNEQKHTRTAGGIHKNPTCH